MSDKAIAQFPSILDPKMSDIMGSSHKALKLSLATCRFIFREQDHPTVICDSHRFIIFDAPTSIERRNNTVGDNTYACEIG